MRPPPNLGVAICYDAPNPTRVKVQCAESLLAGGSMKTVEIDGPLDALSTLHDIPGLDVHSGVNDLGGGRFRRSALVRLDAAIPALEARGLTVRVKLSDSDWEQRVARHRELMRDAPREPPPATQAAKKPDSE